MIPELLNKAQPYNPGDEERKFILEAYKSYQECFNLKQEKQAHLDGRTLKQFWDDSRADYDVLVGIKDPNDPVTQYASAISRDTANGFISNLTMQLLYPSVTAQNENQEMDNVAGIVCRALLEWAHDNDGFPSENGLQKNTRYTHTQVVDGTVHIQDDIIEGRHFSQLIPNEEWFVPNFRQPNLQLQPYCFRCQENITYEEAESIYWALPNWKSVVAGPVSNWPTVFGDFVYKQIIEEHKVQIVHIWKQVPKSKLKDGVKQAKYYNVLVNGVLMFAPENLLPYDDGFYNVTKGVFEYFSDANYYWGNSSDNKGRQDKKWLDGWKTLIRHKAKLSTIPSLITYNGFVIDEDMFIPGRASQAPVGMKPEDIGVVPGTNTGVTQSDMLVLNDAKNEIQSGGISNQGMGKESEGAQTAREAVIREENEQKILGSFGLQVGFVVQARTFPILQRLLQFISYDEIRKICIPDQYMGEGKYGSLEIVFQDNPAMTEEQQMAKSFDILKEQDKSEKQGKLKKIIFADKKYFRKLNLFVKAVPEVKPKRTSAFRKTEALEKYQVYASDPETFNKKASARKLVREMGDDPLEMINQAPPPEAVPQGENPTLKPNKTSKELSPLPKLK